MIFGGPFAKSIELGCNMDGGSEATREDRSFRRSDRLQNRSLTLYIAIASGGWLVR